MSHRETTSPAPHRPRAHAAPCDSTVPTTGITVYGCGPDEAAAFQELAPRYGVVPTLTEAAPSGATIDLARGNRCISISHRTPVTRPTLRELARVGVAYVSTRSVGHDHIDVDEAARMGIRVETIAYSPDGVADYTLMLMLMAVRDAAAIVSRAAVGDYRLPEARGKELRDLTVGVIGTGRIGTAVVDRLRGFGCRVLAHDTRPTSSAADHVPLDALLQHSDVVTLHTPLTAGTRHLLGRRRIGRMRPGAYVVNTARGALVDTEALVRALEAGRLGGAALDVLEGEEGVFSTDHRERPVESPLLRRLHRLPNVVISPHTAYFTDHALADVVESTLVGCRDFQGGDRRG